MAISERKYKGSLTLGRLEIALEAHEALFGCLTKLEPLLTYTVATYDDSDYPLGTLALKPMIGNQTPSTPTGATHMFNGSVIVLGGTMPVAVYRTD